MGLEDFALAYFHEPGFRISVTVAAICTVLTAALTTILALEVALFLARVGGSGRACKPT